jgi:hypothetical protein
MPGDPVFEPPARRQDERQVLKVLHEAPTLIAARCGQALIADKNYYGREFEVRRPTPASSCYAGPARATRTAW